MCAGLGGGGGLSGGYTTIYGSVKTEMRRADEVSEERNRKLDNLSLLHFCDVNCLNTLFQFLQGF